MSRTVRVAGSLAVVATAAAIAVGVTAIATATPTDDAFVIDRFHREVTATPDGSLAVVESIDVTFLEPRRGLLRDIEPDGPAGSVEVQVSDVTRGGAAEPFARESGPDGGVRIRIGDAAITHAPGPQDYVLDYRLDGLVFRPADDPDLAEIRLDVPGDAWTTTVATTELVLHVPGPVAEVHCVVGMRGATTPCTEVAIDGATVTATLPALAAHQTGTVAVRLPASAFTADLTVTDVEPLDAGTATSRSTMPIVPATLLLFALTALPVAAFVVVCARRVYRDVVTDAALHDRATPTAELTAPDGRRPAELAALLRRPVSTDVLLATLVDLQLRGAVTTDQDGDEVTVTPLPTTPDADLAAWERDCRDALCPDGSTATFDGTFRRETAERVRAAHAAITAHTATLLQHPSPYVHARGMHLRGGRFAALVVAIIAATAAVATVGAARLGLPVAAAIATGLGVLVSWLALAGIWASARLPLTSQGRDVIKRTRAFRRFLREVHADRLEFAASQTHTGVHHPAVALLPFAMALGLAEAWLARFEAVIVDAARAGNAGAHVDASSWFVHSASWATASSAYRGTVTSPSSSSSGFGGGGAGSGGGGGGGSSW